MQMASHWQELGPGDRDLAQEIYGWLCSLSRSAGGNPPPEWSEEGGECMGREQHAREVPKKL